MLIFRQIISFRVNNKCVPIMHLYYRNTFIINSSNNPCILKGFEGFSNYFAVFGGTHIIAARLFGSADTFFKKTQSAIVQSFIIQLNYSIILLQVIHGRLCVYANTSLNQCLIKSAIKQILCPPINTDTQSDGI